MVFAVDFDNTLCHSIWPNAGEPNWPVINKLKSIQAAGHCLVLWTCREGVELQIAVDWCREQGLVFEAVNDNPVWLQMKHGNNCRKIGADYFLDDRALSIERFLSDNFNVELDTKEINSGMSPTCDVEDDWIPTSVRLPAETDIDVFDNETFVSSPVVQVIVRDTLSGKVFTHCDCTSDGVWCNFDKKTSQFEVLAWKPMPELPEQYRKPLREVKND